MFKQLSQIGNNLKEELAKSLQDDNFNDNGGTLPEEYLQYPKDVQLKLRKLNKYENKYPQLLHAYKTEKSKNSQNEQIFKILSEHTPIQSFDFQLNSSASEDTKSVSADSLAENQVKLIAQELKNYFENIQLKTDMLNEEIKNLTVEINISKRENQDLKEKLTKAENLDKNKEVTLNEPYASPSTDAETTTNEDTSQKEWATKESLLEKALESTNNKQVKIKEPEVREQTTSDKTDVVETNTDKTNVTIEKTKSDVVPQTEASVTDKDNNGKEELPLSASSSKETSPDSEIHDSKTEKKPRSAIQWQIKYNSLNTDHEALKVKYDTLKTQHDSMSKNLKSKVEELDNVRDMLKEVGNQLVEVKDRSKETDMMAKKCQELEKSLKLEASSKKNIMNAMASQKEEFTKKIEAFNVSFKKETQAKKDIQNSLDEKEKSLNQRVDQLKDVSNKLSQCELDLKHMKLKHERFTKNNENAAIERDQYKKQAETLNKSIEEKIKENGVLSERLSILQEKLDKNKNIEENSTDFVEDIKRQCNELNIKLRETIKLKNSMEDELNETVSILREKSRELSNLKRSINDQDMHASDQIENWKRKYQLSLEMNKKLENELNLVILTQKDELQAVKQHNEALYDQIKELQLTEINLKKQVSDLRNSFDTNNELSQRSSSASEMLTSTIDNLKSELNKSIKLSREYEQTNVEMKKLNQELNLKFDRLSKNYKSLSLQMKQSKSNDIEYGKSSMRRHSSITSMSSLNEEQTVTGNPSSSLAAGNQKTSNDDDYDSKLSYIKNVLIGFLEHKEQRQQLLPVVSMLLKFTNQEEQKFLTSLK